jgi:RNA polymerase sigma-70 factor, ECF subfamily
MNPGEMPAASPARSVDSTLEPALRSDEPIAAQERSGAGPRVWTFDAVYHTYASFVWRNARRLGVPPAAVDDVMQEVFLVVHRRLSTFEERTSVRAWLSAILIRVVRSWRRTTRKGGGARELGPAVETDSLVDARTRSPLEHAERDEAVRELYAVLASMDDERREVLVLSELEELTAPEIADALQVNVNTVYWRLRTARREFERILFRRRAALAAGAR